MNSGVCTSPNVCNCTGTGYSGPICSIPRLNLAFDSKGPFSMMSMQFARVRTMEHALLTKAATVVIQDIQEAIAVIQVIILLRKLIGFY